ncbi:glycosyltransferase [Aquisalimonas lutea]|uniref:glycosyltransferase n=1 Tax=Aquisalimonas lutea TaxID=1327750 RepID=UPI0025B580C5|nr:glycosyltransferase [Aquisalimonas lutea]MDN3519385.1 glycosyltransferase [Aquisalimonas lutea]
MNVFITTYGTRGDVQPYVALGQGLQAAGHHVTLATSERFRGFVEEHGLAYGYMNDGLLALLDTEQGREILENTDSMLAVVRRTLATRKQLAPVQAALLEEGWASARKSDPDVILFHPKAYGGPHFAEKLGVPAIAALVVPMLLPTAEHPHIGFPRLRLGGWYNRATYRAVRVLMALSAGRHVRAWRAANNLPPQRRLDIFRTAGGAPIPVLHGFSRHVVPVPSDWPTIATTTGYWFLAQDEHEGVSTAIEAFLEAGPPPAYIGFGSMTGGFTEDLERFIIDALREAGVRGIVATGRGGAPREAIPGTVLLIDQVPHDRLFPRMAAVVHHGGAGTTAAALRAGTPAVTVPFFGDQFYWGHRVHALGAGCRPIPWKKLTVAAMAAAIREATSDPAMKRRADELGGILGQEDGVGNAVAAVERIVQGG